MGRGFTSVSLKQIGTLLEAGAIGQLTDRQLLERFLAGSGGAESEAAFEVLVRRHGPMVQNVCRKLLRDSQSAEDAFQATFLVLARRAGSIRERDAVASWLFGVASRVAARARADAGRRRSLERRAAEQRLERTELALDPMDLSAELFEEVHRLPDRYRAPVVLCYLEGLSHEQAAGTLRCPVRTLQTRLLRAKARLRTRLIKRGLAPAVGMLAVERLASEAGAVTAASLPFAMIDPTTHAATGFAMSRGGTAPLALASASALTLAQGVLQAMVALLVRYDRDLAGSIARPIIERFRTPLSDFENRYLDRYAVFPTLALADPRGVAELVEMIPDLKEEGIGQSRDIVRLIVAGALAAPESEFWTIIMRSVHDLEFVERDD
jgi:RNA polymerase sigma factor (sigma-70 family)